MNSFTLMAIGNLARDPEAAVKGGVAYTRFGLIGNDFAGKDEQGNPRELTTSVWFVAFDRMAEVIAQNARKGDQLVVEAQLRSNHWTDKEGERQYENSYVVQGFRFGAPGRVTRGAFAAHESDA